MSLLGVVLVGVLAGCGSDDDESADSEPAATTETTDTTADAPAPSTSSTTSVRTDESALPEAADGSDLAACSDGNCEVLVTAFPVDLTFDSSVVIPSLTFESVGPDELTTLTVDSAGTSRMTAREGGASAFLGGDRRLVVSPVAIADGAAVIRLTFG